MRATLSRRLTYFLSYLLLIAYKPLRLLVRLVLPAPRWRATRPTRGSSAGPMSSSCTICTDELDGPCSVTACGHLFHTKCLFAWFEHQPVCPLCKTQPTGRRADFVRELRAPERIEMPHGGAYGGPMEPAAAQEPPSPQAETRVHAAIAKVSRP